MCAAGITTDEVAKQLGVASSTLRKWRTRGIGPPFTKLGGAIRYAPDSISDWISRQTYQATSEYAAR